MFSSPRRYVVVTPEGEVVRGPMTVGSRVRRFDNFLLGFHQTRAVRLGSTILFAEGLEQAHECTGLRVMHEDGSDAHDAPWQLPCREEGGPFLSWVDMVVLGEHAAIVWSEYAGVHGDPTTETRVRMALLDADGRLASAPITVTRSSTASPFEGIRTSLWVDGEQLLVSHAVPEGLFVDTIGCAPLD
ncbi:MAG: hypothetical protein AB7S26_19885 [Sandaracinaceae bacterium]